MMLPSGSVWEDGRAEPQPGAACAPVGLAAAEPGWRQQLRLLQGCVARQQQAELAKASFCVYGLCSERCLC